MVRGCVIEELRPIRSRSNVFWDQYRIHALYALSLSGLCRSFVQVPHDAIELLAPRMFPKFQFWKVASVVFDSNKASNFFSTMNR